MPPVGQPSERSLFRAGAVAIAFATVFGIIGAFHPQPEPGDSLAFLESVSATGAWNAIHFAIFAQFVALLVAWVAIFQWVRREPGTGVAWTWPGLAFVVVGTAIGTVWMMADGPAMKNIAEEWAAAAPSEQHAAFLAAHAVEQVILSLFSIMSVVYWGIPFLFFGAAMLASPAFARWLGWWAVAVGAAQIVAGLVQLYTGRTTAVMHAATPTLLVVGGVWFLPIAVMLWRKAGHPVGAADPSAAGRAVPGPG